jgi:hypothetical protein
MVTRFRWIAGLVVLATMCGASAGQGAGTEQSNEVAATRAQMTALRDAFVKATVVAGFMCPIAPPNIVVEDVPSFGQYNPETNTLRTGAWEQMTKREKGIFYQLAGPGASEEAVRAEFELDAHHWIFVHEMGHWWQACRGAVDHGKHYAQEAGANRIAAAYWRGRDASVVTHMRGAFQMVLDHAPNPMPEGQDVETYFDANYETLGPSPAYPWFQSTMCVTVIDEKPVLSFAEVLKETGAAKEDAFVATRAQLQGLVDDYVHRMKAAGLSCPIAAPRLTIQPTKSWGNYDSESNTIFSPAWEQLGDDDKAFYKMLSGTGADDSAAHMTFEAGAHRWIFVHELGHWWQQCRGYTGTHYAVEFGANRLAAAYWGEADPGFMNGIMGVFHMVYGQGPNPVPQGQTNEGYFNKNYEQLAGTPAYSWYQSQMILTVEREKPMPTFAEALKQVK